MKSKTQSLLIGGLLGAVLGLTAGWLYYNTNVELSEDGQEQLDAPSPGTTLKLGLSLLAFLRSLAD